MQISHKPIKKLIISSFDSDDHNLEMNKKMYQQEKTEYRKE